MTEAGSYVRTSCGEMGKDRKGQENVAKLGCTDQTAESEELRFGNEKRLVTFTDNRETELVNLKNQHHQCKEN